MLFNYTGKAPCCENAQTNFQFLSRFLTHSLQHDDITVSASTGTNAKLHDAISKTMYKHRAQFREHFLSKEDPYLCFLTNTCIVTRRGSLLCVSKNITCRVCVHILYISLAVVIQCCARELYTGITHILYCITQHYNILCYIRVCIYKRIM